MNYKSNLTKKVHEKVHGLKLARKWSEPKIYHGGEAFDIRKDWYIYYSFRNPSTNRLERQPNIKRGNRHKTKLKRLDVLQVYRKALSELLSEGFSPFDEDPAKEEQKTIDFAIDFAMNHKRETWSDNNYNVMRARVNVFKEFLRKKKLLKRPPEAITKQVINEFLDEVMKNTTASNRNNYRAGLSPLFSFLVTRDLVSENYFLKIPKLSQKSKGVKVYSKKLKNSIVVWLKENDAELLLFIQVFTFGMIRPIEAARLKVKDFNLDEGYFYVNAKQKETKKKIISKLLRDVLPDIEHANPEHLLFTPSGVGLWNRTDNGRREYYSKRFTVMRDVLQFDTDLKMYNFRHTVISELYVNLIQEHGKNKAIELLKEITGHSTEKALFHYLKTTDAYLPPDFSKYLTD